MPQTGAVTILGIDQNSGISKKTGKPWTRFDVKASDGRKYSTFEAPVAQAAGQSNGAPVFLEFEERLNGEYTNYDLKGVTLANGQAQVAAPVVAQVQASPSVTPAVTSGEVASTYQQDKEARITRLSAASTAFSFASAAGIGPDEAIALAGRIEQYAYGQIPEQAFDAPQPAQAETGTPLPWEQG